MYSSLPLYAELHCLSNFSFLRGASHPRELVERAAELGYSALAITDECSVAGAVRAYEASKDTRLPLIIGSEFALEGGPRVVLLATSRESYGKLSALITVGRSRAAKGGYRLCPADLDGGVPGCVALLCPRDGDSAELLRAQAGWLAERFAGRAWIAAELLCGPDDRARLALLRALSAHSGLPLTAAGDVHMHVRSRRRLQDVQTAIRLGRTVTGCGQALYPNAERHLRLRMRLAQLCPPELLAESTRIAERCLASGFTMEDLKYEYPEELVPAGETPATHLRRLTETGLAWRYPEGVPAEVGDQVEQELALIAELRYEAFFLTVHDIVRYARSRNILCQGRGSAANSAVCYALGVTEVNPAKQKLLFGRFLSRERKEAPDIDVDFEHERREEVIQYVYDKYGRGRAAIAATVICYRPKSALRDVGKALGLPLEQVDRIAKSVAWWDDRNELDQRLAAAGFDPASPVMRRLCELALAIQGFPRHLSQHVGGFVISRGPLAELVPIENAAMKDRSVIQWDKDDLESLGLLKVDVLALGMLTAIRRALDMINRGRAPGRVDDVYGLQDMDSILKQQDKAVYGMIQRADTVGVFQIESRAQMSMLPRLKPENFYDLVIEVAIVRPGPIQGGMVHPYLKRRNKEEPFTYPSPEVEEVLGRTLGVPIFQEQVMRLAEVAAGFTTGEADQLRRSMAAWKRKGGLGHLKQRLIDGMLERGYKREYADRIYQQITGFGEYGFPESHSASFALLTYVSSWLKCHHPAAFLAALLNSQPMGFYQPAQLVIDARRHGVSVLPADVNRSDWECSLEEDPELASGTRTPPPAYGAYRELAMPAVRLGLLMVKGLAKDSAVRIVSARAASRFASVDDLHRRAALDRNDLQRLAAADALAGLAGHRRQAFWQVAGVEGGGGLLHAQPVHEAPVELPPPGEGASITADYASTGLTLGLHPLALLRGQLARRGFVTAKALQQAAPGRPIQVAGIVTGRQRPGTASGVVFVTLEDETGNVNVIVWRHMVERQRKALLGARLMGVHGRVERASGVVHLIADRLSDHSALLGALAVKSRDFH
jgi:error-prone DNA polymerase